MSGDRRRRVLRDEAQGSTSAPARKAKTSGERYTDQAKHAHLPRLIDLVPKRGIWVCVWFVLGLASIAAIFFADFARDQYLVQVTELKTTGLRISGYATLASWWSTVCLLSCAYLAAAIYTIRSHRVDDYRGRYRQWAVVAFFCVLASACLSAPIHETIQSVSVYLTGRDLAGRPALWWMLPAVLVGGIVGLRAFLDMRPCKSGPFFLVLAGIAYVAVALGQIRVLEFESIATDVWMPVTFLVGHYCLLWSLCLSARYVYLDAQGELKLRVKKVRKKKKPKTDDEADVIQMEEGRSKAKPKKRRKPAEVDSAEDHDDEEMSLAEMELLTNPDLTRAERRKLRKKLKRDRRAA